MHEHDRQRVDPGRARVVQCRPRGSLVERNEHLAIDAHPLVNLDHAVIEHCRQHDVPREYLGPRLVADAQRILETARDRERDAPALPLEQRVGGDRRAHPHFGDRSAFVGQDAPDRFERGILVMRGIFRQQLFDPQPPLGRTATTSVNVPPRSIAKVQLWDMPGL